MTSPRSGLLLTLAFALGLPVHAQERGRYRDGGGQAEGQSSPAEVERAIADGVNEARENNGLPPLPVSRLLTQVARAHVRDLDQHHPDAQVGAGGRPCSVHSWSAHGRWSAVCYTGAMSEAARMWSKPREITGGAYPYNGYEIAVGFPPGQGDGAFITADAALRAWRDSPAHRDTMLERGVWSARRWRAMGIGVEGGYAVVWFGPGVDPKA